MEIKPLGDLPDADRAKAILERLKREFLPIAKARGYTVTSLSEMCCCGDAGRRGRGGRLMSNNVWGYNQTSGRRGTCRISIRLRQPSDHGALIPYENAAGTMAHELAHCVHGNHSAAFYKLMDEIAEQHAEYVARGLVVDKDGFPMGGQSHTLGGRGGGVRVRNTTGSGGGDLRDAVRKAAEERSKRPAPMQPQKLGTGNGTIDPKLPPKEAARLAAERRALLDSKWCLPCNEVIEILSDDDESAGDSDSEKKVAGKSSGSTTAKNQDVTDLTANSDKKKRPDKRTRASASADDEAVVPIDLTESPQKPPKKKAPKDPIAAAAASASATSASPESETDWACTACTLQNRPNALACGACGKARWSNGDAAAAAAAAERTMRRDEAIEAVRENEVRQSEDTFGGFNIYGSSRRKTGTLPHLT